MKKAAVILFEGFQTLDAMGPIEVLGNMKDEYEMHYVSAAGGLVNTFQNVQVMTERMSELANADLVVIPGGRSAVDAIADRAFISQVKEYVEKAQYCLTVCTGSLILAVTGLLQGKAATTNKMAFNAVTPNFPGVEWKASARWVHDGKFYTASGVSAGIDMVFAFIRDQYGDERFAAEAREIEYVPREDPLDDPFAVSTN